MHRVKVRDNLEAVPRPCDYFDLIGGTSTGGYAPSLRTDSIPTFIEISNLYVVRLVALMLGR